jgi:O-antigen/teichoic acid export membrane protein
MKYLKMSCWVVFPMMALLATIAKPLVLIILTDKWLPSAALISILAIAYMFMPIMIVNNQILNVKGRSDYFLKAEIIKKIVAIAILIITMPFGVKILCLGVILYNIFDMIVIIAYAKKVIPTGYLMQIKALAPIITIVAIAGAISYCMQTMTDNTWTALCIGIFSYLLIFIVSCIIIKPKELIYLKHFIKR